MIVIDSKLDFRVFQDKKLKNVLKRIVSSALLHKYLN